MATHLVTGYAGSEHIKSEDQGSFNASFFGTGQFVMEAGNQLEASIIDNNTVRILDGDILMKGRHIRVNPDTYEDMIIENGTAGVNRCDLIVMEYSKVPETGIETATLKVLKGAATSGTASAPSYTDGDILTGAILNQMPLYKVLIEGVVLVDVVSLFDTIPTFQTLAEMYRAKFIKDCETHLNSLGILDTMEEINANTQDNQLAGALAVMELASYLGDIRYASFVDDANSGDHMALLKANWENLEVTRTYIVRLNSGYQRVAIVQKYATHDWGSVLIFGYGQGQLVYHELKDGVWDYWEITDKKDLENYLPLSGGELRSNLIVGDGSNADFSVRARSNTRLIGLQANGSSSASSAGIYDFVNHRWLISNDGVGATLMNDGKKILTSADFVVTGSTNEATLTINLD